jgi:DNA invertase Pin-like site-specific DNA recombinase
MPRKRNRINRYHHPKSPELQARNQMIVGSRMMGATITALATGYGLSRSHVHRIVAGVPILLSRPKRPRKSRARPERWLRFFQLRSRARDLRKRGYSYREISDRLGISHGCAYNAARMVKIAELRGRAWLSHEEGRPRSWQRELLARTGPPIMPLASKPARGMPGYAVPS